MTEYLPYGTSGYGTILPWGSIIFPRSGADLNLGEFNFEVIARSEGYKIRIRFAAPAVADSPDWSRRLKILRKQGEWPRTHDDSGAYITVDDTYPTAGTRTIIEDDLVEGQIYYYALFLLGNDGEWYQDRFVDRGSAYPYGRWGHAEYFFNSMPRGCVSYDASNNGDLQSFLTIFGALLDNMKTDAEHLLTTFEIEAVHDDLIFLLDKKIGWPTWHAAPGLQRRKETAEAVSLYTDIGIGRSSAYEQILEEISDWDSTVVEGWRSVFFSNGLYESTTPDLSTVAKQEEIQRLRGRQGDLLKYTNDNEGWHSVAGLAFFLEEIPGVSGAFTGEMLERYQQMIEWAKGSYVKTRLILVSTTEETVGSVSESWTDVVS